MRAVFQFCRHRLVRNVLLALALFAALSVTDAIAADTIAFTAPGGLTTTSTSPANLGVLFTANANFSVVALGIYYDPPLLSPETVGLYDQSGNLLASTTIQLSDTAIAGYLFASIAPVALTAGNQYTVAAFVGGNSGPTGTRRWRIPGSPITGVPIISPAR
jgi:hypothetical protein